MITCEPKELQPGKLGRVSSVYLHLAALLCCTTALRDIPVLHLRTGSILIIEMRGDALHYSHLKCAMYGTHCTLAGRPFCC